MRIELPLLERGEHLLRRKEVYEQLYLRRSRAARLGRWAAGRMAKGATVTSFAEDTAAKTGLSVRTNQYDEKITRLGDDTKVGYPRHAALELYCQTRATV